MPNQNTLFDLDSVFEVDDYLYFYSESLTDERSEAEVQAIVRELEMQPPMKVLDLACGFGRHTNRLALQGYQMTGVDRMPGFIDLARKGAKERGIQVDYRVGDMRSIDFKDEFDRVLLIFTAFGYFEDEENLQVVKNIACALKPGGWLVFDSLNRDAALKNFLPAIVTEKNGDLMIDRNHLDSLTGRMHNDRIVIRNGVRKDKPFSFRIYNPSEIKSLLAQAGLEPYKILGSWDGQPASTESRRMIVIAQKH